MVVASPEGDVGKLSRESAGGNVQAFAEVVVLNRHGLDLFTVGVATGLLGRQSKQADSLFETEKDKAEGTVAVL